MRAELTPSEYLDYLSYQINLDKLFNVRYKKLLSKHDNFLPKAEFDTIKSMQKSLIKQINYIFERACRRFPQEVSLYESHISFLREKQCNNLLDILFGRILSLFPTNVKFWIQASTHELHVNNNLHASRVIMQRALRSINVSTLLWKHLFDLELFNILRSVERKKALGLLNDSTNVNDVAIDKAEVEKEITQLQGPLIVVFRHACKSLLSNQIDNNSPQNESKGVLSVEFSNLWSIMKMIMSVVTIDSSLSTELKKILEDTLMASNDIPKDHLIQQYLLFYDILEKLHYNCMEVLVDPSQTNNSNGFENFQLILQKVATLWDETAKFSKLSESNPKYVLVRQLLPFVISISRELSSYLFSLVREHQQSNEDILQDLDNIYISFFEQLSSGILLYRTEISLDIFRKVITQSSLLPEMHVIILSCVKLSNTVKNFIDFEMRSERLDASVLSKFLLCGETLSGFIMCLSDDHKIDNKYCEQCLSEKLFSHFKNISTRKVKEIGSHNIGEINQFAELLKSLHPTLIRESTISRDIITEVLTFLFSFTRGSNANDYLESYFFPYLSFNRKILNDLPMPSWFCESNAVGRETLGDPFDSIYRSFLLSNTDGSESSNSYQSRYLLNYVQISLKFFREEPCSNVKASNLVAWVLWYMQKYSLLLLPCFAIDVQDTNPNKANLTQNLYWKIYILLWEILNGVSEDGKEVLDFRKTFLHEIFVNRDELTSTIEDGSLRAGRELLLEEFSKYCRADGRHDLANHLQFKRRRFA